MASISDDKDRHVIPNWRSFNLTASLGELGGIRKTNTNSQFSPDISDLLQDWEEDKSIALAGDILGAVIVGDITIDDKIKSINEYVCKNSDKASNSLIKTVDHLRGEIEIIVETDLITLESINERDPSLLLYKQIAYHKQELIKNPHNAVLWVELARLYSIQGQDIKADRAMRNATFIAPENRFVLRSMARFFAHAGDLEFAHHHLKKANITRHDPWVQATEISIADLRGRNSKFAKDALKKINSKNFRPFSISELSSAMATLEMEHGSIKKSKKLFKSSLIDPNDNSLAQAEWASHKELKLDSVEPSKFNVANNYEALARDAKQKGEYELALDHSKKWFMDMPFSKGSVLFAYDVALHKLNNEDLASSFGKLGLLAHPHDPHLLNNIAYSLALGNRTSEAYDMIGKIRFSTKVSDESSRICLIATKGLVKYREGYAIEGKELYLTAIELSKAANFEQLTSLAIANLAREELLTYNELDSDVLDMIQTFKNMNLDDEVKEILRNIASKISKNTTHNTK